MLQETSGVMPENRLKSLDFYRGFTMFLLIAESTHLFEYLVDPSLMGTLIESIGMQFHHHPWNGLRFWDLVQPFFMFIVGVALPFSAAGREARGESGRSITRHAVKRSFLLLLFGWALYCIGPGHITFELWNVLAQLSFTYLVAFFMMAKPVRVQLVFTVGLLLLTESLYRLWPIPGFDQPFEPDHNFGSYIDLLIMGKLSGGHWVAFNAVPTTAHTMWGVLCGQLLKSEKPAMQKVYLLIAAGVIGIITGYALDPVTPIIKRICTSSFVIVSGGWCVLVMGLSYWLVDIIKIHKIPGFFTIVGMNSLFIYLFAETHGTAWVHHVVIPFTNGLFGWMGSVTSDIITAITVWFVLWYICFFLYKKRVFLKI